MFQYVITYITFYSCFYSRLYIILSLYTYTCAHTWTDTFSLYLMKSEAGACNKYVQHYINKLLFFSCFFFYFCSFTKYYRIHNFCSYVIYPSVNKHFFFIYSSSFYSRCIIYCYQFSNSSKLMHFLLCSWRYVWSFK